MKIKNYKCTCGCKDFYFKESNGKTINTVGIYCSYCGKWFKWADKWEKNLQYKDGGEDDDI